MVEESYYVEPLATFFIVRHRRTIDGWIAFDYPIFGAVYFTRERAEAKVEQLRNQRTLAA